RVLVNGTFLK
nr:Chain C, Non-structural protein 1 peptide RVLVNGTFLK [Influenza B virus]